MVSRRAFLGAVAAAPVVGAARRSVAAEVTALTYNLGIGADLYDAIDGETVRNREVYRRFAEVKRSAFPQRADAIARLIEESGADLVGLQEVALLRRGPADAERATTVVVDFLAELRAALSPRDADYDVAVVSENADVEFRADPPDGESFDVRLTDRDVILTRTDVEVTGTETATFLANASKVVEGRRISTARGYAIARCVVDGVPMAFVTTHLASRSELLRRAQAAQLLSVLGAKLLPVVVAGDFNSQPTEEGVYDAFDRAFRAASAVAEPGETPESGRPPTCCQRPTLDNDRSSLTMRIDEVFVSGPVDVRDAWRVGEDPASRVSVDGEPLWPSDHAGVAARLAVRPFLSDPLSLTWSALWED